MNIPSTESDHWVVRAWRKLIAWHEATNTRPIEQLDKRVAAVGTGGLE
jgi:hypothetical protein